MPVRVSNGLYIRCFFIYYCCCIVFALLQVNVDSPHRFQCPPEEADRFSLPDIRDHDKEEQFKAGGGFIYYQHLRKAGGTGFCEMAGRCVSRRTALFLVLFVTRGPEISLISGRDEVGCAGWRNPLAPYFQDTPT